MSWTRIKAILLQEWYVLYRSGEVITDIVVFPVGHIVVFGFISLFLSQENKELGELVLLGMILWQVVWIVEYALTLGSLWNIWSRNLTNLFISPLRLSEYIFAHTLSGVVKAFLVFVCGSALSYYVFNFNILDAGILVLTLTFINLSLFAYALGVAILGLIFRFGTRVQAAAWGLVTILQPLMAPFYPVDVMPQIMQYIAYLFPATYTFEAARHGLATGGEVAWGLFAISFVGNGIYCVVCTFLFLRMYDVSRDTGQFARNEV
jgi:ABC-2 type transport system permease protein